MTDKLKEMISFFTDAVTNFEEGEEVYKDHYIETFNHLVPPNSDGEDCIICANFPDVGEHQMPQFCMNCNCLSFQCVWGVTEWSEGEEEQLCPRCFNRAYFFPTTEEVAMAKKYKY